MNGLNFGGRRQLKFIQQAEASECGLACIAMIADYHGMAVDLPALRRRFDVGLRGATVATLIAVAEELGFKCRPLRGEVDDLQLIALPAILHWNLNHYVVLESVTTVFGRRTYKISDPALAQSVLTEEQISESFTGVILELARSGSFKPAKSAPSLKFSQLWSGLRGYAPTFATILALSAAIQFIALAMPFYLQLGMDDVLPAGDTDLLETLALGFAGLAVINMASYWVRSLSVLQFSGMFSFQLVDNVIRHLLSLPLSWFERRHVGDVVSRFNASQQITDFFNQALVTTAIDGVMAILTMAIMLLYSTTLSLVVIIFFLTYVILRWSSYATLRLSNVSSATAAARESTNFIETIRGIATIKSMGKEINRINAWQGLKIATINSQQKIARISAKYDALTGLALSLERILSIYLALRMVISGSFTIGMLFAFQAYKQQFMDAASRLIDQALKLRLLRVQLNRLADIVTSQPEARIGIHHAGDPSAPTIRLINVSFRYALGDPFVLKDVNIDITAGEFVALTGPSGAGKTTVLKLILGVLEPTSGVILVNGRPLDRSALQQWRAELGTVLQEDRLFAGTLVDNITFFDRDADMAAVRKACEDAAILLDIGRMPLGFETLVGDMGSSLSGGQRQRVMLARALYRNGRALIMDEGTAHLDHSSEAQIVRTLANLPITRIVSSHRPLTLNAAERVLMVEGGQVRLAIAKH